MNFTSENFLRFSGLVLLIGGLLATSGWILFSIFDPRHVNVTAPSWRFFNLLVIFGGVFMAMGLPGFYLSMAGRSSALAWAGLVILFIGFAIPYIAVQSIETATSPARPPFFELLISIGGPSIFIGILLTALVIYTSGVYPRWTAIALVVAALLGLLTLIVRLPPVLARGGIFPAIYTVVMAFLGYLAYIRGGE
jgi:hypothetical protein